jgi:hypothetical protein
MSVLRVILSAIGEIWAPDPTYVKNRVRISVDHLLTVGITLLAVALAVGYQVLGRFGPRFFGDGK